MVILYIVLLVLFTLVEFRWSYNRSSRDIGNILELPLDGGNGIEIMTLILFLACEVVGVIAVSWLTLIVPYIIVRINAPRALKKAVQKFIYDNEQAGIPREETIKLIASKMKFH